MAKADASGELKHGARPLAAELSKDGVQVSTPASPAKLVILVDTREQRPLTLPNSRRATLKVADYSVEGFTDLIAVERKSHEDFVGCVGKDRDRFERELAKLAMFEYPAIVLECTMADLLAGTRFSEVHPHAAVGSLIAWSVKYRVPVWLAGDRRTAAATVRKILEDAVKYIQEKE